jgi:hypothetical protein
MCKKGENPKSGSLYRLRQAFQRVGGSPMFPQFMHAQQQERKLVAQTKK